jgi:hypothetical protein
VTSLAFQIIFIVFSVAAAGAALRRHKANELSARAAWFWVLFWLVADLAVLWPDAVTRVANRFGIGRGTDFVVYVAMAAMFFLLFRFHVKLELLNRDITKVVRRDALHESRNMKHETNPS